MNFEIDLEKDFVLKIGAHEIKVFFVPPEDVRLKEGPREDALPNHGIYNCETYEIYIRNNNPYSMKFSTLLHESIHALEDIYQIKISHKDINLLGEIFSQILISNFSKQEKQS